MATAAGRNRAACRGSPGHREGSRAVRRAVEAAIRSGVSWLTIYAFSSENWRRPAGEILDLTGLLRRYLRSEIAELKQSGVRLRFIGDRCRFDADIQIDLEAAERDTAANSKLNLTIALSYGARAEIAAAARAALEAVRDGGLDAGDLGEEMFARFLATAGMPDPDLIIRTSGEQRLSNFLLWQAAYAELVFLDVLWPDFDQAAFQPGPGGIRAARAAIWRSQRLGRQTCRGCPAFCAHAFGVMRVSAFQRQ